MLGNSYSQWTSPCVRASDRSATVVTGQSADSRGVRAHGARAGSSPCAVGPRGDLPCTYRQTQRATRHYQWLVKRCVGLRRDGLSWQASRWRQPLEFKP